MRLLVTCLTALCILSPSPSQAAWDIFQSYVILDSGSGDQFLAGGVNADGATAFAGTDLGDFTTSDALTLNGGELKTYKNGSSNVCGGNLNYRVYASGDTPGAFSAISLTFDSDLGGGDQKWAASGAGIDLLGALAAGDYVLELYWEASGDDAGGCTDTKFDSDFGNNFTATFSIVAPTYDVTNTTTGVGYSDIQTAIDAATAGDALSLAATTFSPSGQITLNKALSLTGAGSGSTTINGGGTGYAIAVTADNVHLEGFTLNGAGSYGIKVSNSTTSAVQDFSMTDVATDGTTRTGIDLNGVDGATLTNIAGHNTASGFGLAIASSADITVDGLTTSGNAWGDAAVYPAATEYQIAGYEAPTNITFGGTLSLSSGTGALSIQDGALASGGTWTGSISNDAGDNADITVPSDFDGCVNATRNDGLSFHTVSPGAVGEGIVGVLTAATTPFTYTAITFQNLTSGEWAVFGDLLIQDAIDAASAGDAIELEGSFSPSATINVDKSLTLYGQGSASTTIDVGGYNNWGIYITADDVSLSGVTIQGDAATNEQFALKAGSGNNTGGTPTICQNLSYSDIVVQGTKRTGIDINGVNGATLTDITCSGATGGFGMSISSSADITVTNLTTSGNAWGDVGIFPANSPYQWPSLEGPTGITFDGTVNLSDGAGSISVQDGSLQSGGTWVGSISNDAADNADVTVPATFTHVVNSTRDSDGLVLHNVGPQAAIHATALALVGSGAFSATTIDDLDNGDIEVIEGLSIQEAIDAASAGDEITLAAGTYTEDLTINKGVSLNGPNAGTAHDGTRSAEAILAGQHTLSAIDAATIDGVQFLNDDAGAVTSSLTIASAAGHLVQNNLFVSSVAGGNTGGTHDKGIYINSLSSGSLTISENGFSGDGSFTDGDRYSTAPWGRGIWMNGGGATITISDNAFTNCRTGINLEAHDNAAHTISGNTFTDCGSGMSLGNPTATAITSITGNRFQDVDTDINARNLTQDLEWDLAATDNLASPGNSTVYSDLGYIPGNSAGDIDDPNGNMAFLSGNGEDRLTFGADDNTITGDLSTASNDYLDGGDGTDQANYADNEADITLTTDDALIIIASPTAGTDTLLNIEYLVLADATLSLIGCTFPDACNYIETALIDDDSCEFDSCAGCRDEDACNYDATATLDGPLGTCTYPGLYQDCAGDCLNDANTNGICDEIEAIGVEGCTDPAATNYNPDATEDDGSCYTYTLEGCLIPSATNYDPTVNVQGEPISNFCIFPWNSAFMLPSTDCADSFACNYDAAATGYTECDYCLGCTDDGACNYDDTALYDDGSCTYVGCSGCTSSCSSNYDAAAVIDDGSCDYANCGGCTDSEADNYAAGATIDDGSCQYAGCTLPSACNFDADANANDGSCSLDPAPVISAVELVLNTTSLTTADGEVAVTVDSGSPISFALEGLNGASDLSFAYPGQFDGIAAGYYSASVSDSFGCVSNSLDVVVSYDLCCDCGVSDIDSDGICDDEDNCTDKTAPNYADPANTSCPQP